MPGTYVASRVNVGSQRHKRLHRRRVTKASSLGEACVAVLRVIGVHECYDRLFTSPPNPYKAATHCVCFLRTPTSCMSSEDRLGSARLRRMKHSGSGSTRSGREHGCDRVGGFWLRLDFSSSDLSVARSREPHCAAPKRMIAMGRTRVWRCSRWGELESPDCARCGRP